MCKNVDEYHVPEDWLEELTRLGKLFDSRTEKRNIWAKLKYADCCRYIYMIANNGYIRELFLNFYDWLSEWKQRPESKYSGYSEASDYPTVVHKYVGMFNSWYSLKYNVEGVISLKTDMAYQAYLIIKKSADEDGALNLDRLKTLPFITVDESMNSPEFS